MSTRDPNYGKTYIDIRDAYGFLHKQRIAFVNGVIVPASMITTADGTPVPVEVLSASPDTGMASEETLSAVLAKLSGDPAQNDTLSAILAALGSTLSVAGSVAASVSGTVAVSSMPVTHVVIDGGNISGFSTETTLAALKSRADLLGTETTLAAINSKLGAALPLPTGAASETTLAAINTKLGAALPLPTGAATAVKQDTGNTALGAPADTAVTDYTASASVIAALKGLIRELHAGGPVTIKASSAETTGNTFAAQTTPLGAGRMIVYANVTAMSGLLATFTMKLQGQDPVSGAWFDIPGAATAALVVAVGSGLLTLGLGAGVAAVTNQAAAYPLPRTWRVVTTIGGTTPSVTFSLGVEYVR